MISRHKSVRRAITWLVVIIVVIAAGLTALFFFLSYELFPSWPDWTYRDPLLLVLASLAACIAVGILLSVVLTNRYIKPLSELMDAVDAVANGDFSVRVSEDNAIGEFKDFIHNFNKMTESLAGTEMMRNDFVNTISHEFKTPVASIRGFAKLLQNPGLTEEQKKLYTDTIITESQRLSSMSANILLLTQYEHMEIMSGQEFYSLDEQIRECIRLQERDWLQKDIALSGELEPVTYYGSRELVSHLWSNLLSNAIKFTPEGGEIAVTLTRDGNGLIRASIRDSGIGMDGETLAHIFDKFYQADASRKSDGNGLGLSIVKRIVSLCGGEIEALSRPGEGTEFTVTLPENGPDTASHGSAGTKSP